MYMLTQYPSYSLLKSHSPILGARYSPFLLAFLSGGILLILSIFVCGCLFGHWRFFLLLLLFFARSWLLEYFKVRVRVHLHHLILRDGEGTSKKSGARRDFESLMKFNWHAESEEQQVCVGILRSVCLVGHFETRGSFHGPINPWHLEHGWKGSGGNLENIY